MLSTMTYSMRVLTAAVAAVGATACGPARTPEPLQAFVVQPLAPPAAAGPSSLQLTAAAGEAIVSWIEGGGAETSVRFARRTAAGWSAPTVVVSGERLIANPADVPSVQALDGKRLLAQWLEANGPDPEAYDLRLAWSSDSGATWSAPVSPHDDGRRAQHGFASLFDGPDEGFGLVWLDGRDAAGGLIGDMALRAAAYDRSGMQVSQAVVDARVCECCQTSAVATSDAVLVAYRDRSPEEIRDIAVVRLEGGRWSEPVRVHADEWKLHGCPVNGPAISARGRDVVVAWFTGAGGEGHTYVAFSDNGGRSFDEPIRVDEEGSAGRVQVQLLANGTAAVSWIETGGGRQTFSVRRVHGDGRRSDATAVTNGRMGRQYPRMTLHGSELLFAWIESGQSDLTQLKTAHVTDP